MDPVKAWSMLLSPLLLPFEGASTAAVPQTLPPSAAADDDWPVTTVAAFAKNDTATLPGLLSPFLEPMPPGGSTSKPGERERPLGRPPFDVAAKLMTCLTASLV